MAVRWWVLMAKPGVTHVTNDSAPVSEYVPALSTSASSTLKRQTGFRNVVESPAGSRLAPRVTWTDVPPAALPVDGVSAAAAGMLSW